MDDDGSEPSTQEARTTTATFRSFVPEQRVFNRYLIRQELGRGGRGVVYLAQDLRLFSMVALKFMADELVREPEALEELRHETLVSRKITHPHIMRIYDFEQDAAAAAISMEYVEGATLSQLRYKREQHCFDPEEIKPWMVQLADALYYAHSEARIVHRDLKPSNLMVGPDGKIKITDFGIASVIADSMSRVTRTYHVSGTLPYMSPQQTLGNLPRESDDIYSFGAVIYELLTSRPPFFRGNVAMQIHKAEAPMMAQRRAELGREGPPIPQVWEDIAASCLAKEAEDRPRSAKVIAEWIEKGTRDTSRGIPHPEPANPPPARLSPLHNSRLMLALASLLFVAAIAWVLIPRGGHRVAEVAATNVAVRPAVIPVVATPAPATPAPSVHEPPPKPEPPPQPTPPPKAAPIDVNTSPSGADVFVNEDIKGKSPLRIEGLAVGNWRLKVQREGYETSEIIFDAREDRTTLPPLIYLVRPTPTPAPKKIVIAATPVPAVPPPPPEPSGSSSNAGAIMTVLSSYAQAMQAGDANGYAALCAPRVGYFDEGLHAKDYIRRSRDAFAKLFTNYEVHNVRNISLHEMPGGNAAEVSFIYDWNATCIKAHSVNHKIINPGPKRGAVMDTLDLQLIDGHWLVTKFAQKKL